VKDYLGVNIELDKRNKTMKLTQPDLIKRMEKKYATKFKNMQHYRTPAAPGENMMKSEKDEDLINDEEQTKYRSGVGILLYLTKHLRPELSNCIRELAKVMDGANNAQTKSLMRAIRFVLDSKEKGFLLKPDFTNLKWVMKPFCDSDYSGDKETRKSVTVIIFLIRVLIA
jgi:hypothetical protein